MMLYLKFTNVLSSILSCQLIGSLMKWSETYHITLAKRLKKAEIDIEEAGR